MAEAARLFLDALGYSVADRALVEPLSLQLPLEGCTVILGPNGAGKSTLLQLIHGMLEGQTGCVRISSGTAEPRPVTPGELALVLQRPVMLSRSVQANVEHALAVRGVPRRDRAALASRSLARVGLSAFATRFAQSLSGGEQQRLAIARVIACSPLGLLLDEPCGSLDPGATAAIEVLLIELAATGMGVVMTTHDLAQARRLASRVVFIHQGQILEVSAASAFFNSPQTDLARRFLAGELIG